MGDQMWILKWSGDTSAKSEVIHKNWKQQLIFSKNWMQL